MMWDNLQKIVYDVALFAENSLWYIILISKINSLSLILFPAGECDGNGAAAGGDGGSNSA